jgi:hypothetical protein
LYEELRGFGYEGSYAAVRRYAIGWREKRASETASAYVPLSFAPGEAYQFDWSHEIVVIEGVTTTVKIAHVRLCHSRMMMLARAHPREMQGMVFDASSARTGDTIAASSRCARIISSNRSLARRRRGGRRVRSRTRSAWFANAFLVCRTAR